MNLLIGLIGCGDIGSLRAQAIKQTNSLRLVAATDLDQRRAEVITSKYGGVIEPDWLSLLRREDLNAVIISTPPSKHAEMCIEALNAGKHVLCEKPLARTPAECRNILNAAETNSRILATGFNYRFYPSFQKAKEILDEGIIGELVYVRSYAGYSAADHSQPWIHDGEVVGGGALRDNGIHLIDLTRYFLGEVAEVKGLASNTVWGFKGCEDNGFALFRTSDGKIASLHASWTEWGRYKFLLEICGTRGYIRTSCFPMLTQVAWSKQLGARTKRKTYFFPKTHIMEHLRSYRWVVVQSLVRELKEFYAAIRGQSSLIATGLDGIRSIEIAHAACEQLDNNRLVVQNSQVERKIYP